jgi:hypothetical protein
VEEVHVLKNVKIDSGCISVNRFSSLRGRLYWLPVDEYVGSRLRMLRTPRVLEKFDLDISVWTRRSRVLKSCLKKSRDFVLSGRKTVLASSVPGTVP